MLGLPEQRRSPGWLGEVAKQGWVGPAHKGASCALTFLRTGLLSPLSASWWEVRGWGLSLPGEQEGSGRGQPAGDAIPLP